MSWLEDQKNRIVSENLAEKARVEKNKQETNYYREKAACDLKNFYDTKLKDLERSSFKYGEISFKLDENALTAFSGTVKIFLIRFYYYEADKYEGDCMVPSGEYYLKKIINFTENWVDAKGNSKKASYKDLYDDELAEYLIYLQNSDEK